MHYEVTTQLPPEDTMQEAIVHFGVQGVGLELTHQAEVGLIFKGNGGYVAITVSPTEASNSETTSIELETHEWDDAVQQFISKVN